MWWISYIDTRQRTHFTIRILTSIKSGCFDSVITTKRKKNFKILKIGPQHDVFISEPQTLERKTHEENQMSVTISSNQRNLHPTEIRRYGRTLSQWITKLDYLCIEQDFVSFAYKKWAKSRKEWSIKQHLSTRKTPTNTHSAHQHLIKTPQGCTARYVRYIGMIRKGPS